MQPGTTITPGGEQKAPEIPTPTPQAAPEPIPAPEPPVAPRPQPSPEPQPEATPPAQPAVETPAKETPAQETAAVPAPLPEANWRFNTSQSSADDVTNTFPTMEPISWTASEFVDHEKNRSWFFGVIGATLGVAVIAFIITRDVISSIVIIFAGILLALGGARKPHTLQFQLSQDGLQIGEKLYPYSSFKSFTVLEEGALSSIQLLPAQRFMPSLSVFYPPEQEEAIVTSLGNFVPHEDRPRDAIDRLMRRIKF